LGNILRQAARGDDRHSPGGHRHLGAWFAGTLNPWFTMHPSLRHTDHRPWPLPTQRWSWRQSWRDLLFAHWPVDAAVLRPLIPEPLEVQQHDGTGWLGIVPFRMAGVMRRPLPDLPGVSAFPELNVRTYVSYRDRPGVWFFSLDAANRLAVTGARLLFSLPYHFARMNVAEQPGEGIGYRSQRFGTQPAEFVGTYRPTGPPQLAVADTLDHWLTERYCLYTTTRSGRLLRAEVHHPPWPLQPATLELRRNSMAEPLGIPLVNLPSTLHFSRRIDVVVWNPEPVSC
jgi:uncharacterized protein YqjF (DUF2071 family)